MIRILGNILSKNKKIYIALTTIYGIGEFLAKTILKQININSNTKVSNLTNNNIFELHFILEKNKYKLLGELKHFITLNIQHLININTYKGKRFLKGLPVQGQRTRTNSRTSRKLNLLILKK
jgi:small subunit ribosomal protein S13